MANTKFELFQRASGGAPDTQTKHTWEVLYQVPSRLPHLYLPSLPTLKEAFSAILSVFLFPLNSLTCFIQSSTPPLHPDIPCKVTNEVVFPNHSYCSPLSRLLNDIHLKRQSLWEMHFPLVW